MKAVVHEKYGSSELLLVKEVETPIPNDNEVRVKIVAASLNATDFEIVRGDFIVRIGNGMRKPKNPRLGCDFSGRVDKLGSQVTEFSIGDEVYADLMYQKKSYGALAEYVCIPSKSLRKKPSNLTFNQAATIPQAGVLAVQGIREKFPPKAGQKVLINGAGGGVGTIAIQLAKYYGAEVTVVDHPDKFKMMTSLGADHLIDYTKQDYTKLGKKYDIILDTIARKSAFAYSRCLTPTGAYRMVGGSIRRILGILLMGSLLSKYSEKKIGLLFGRPNDENDMEFLADLYEAKEVVPVIDRIFPLDETPQALKYLQDGLAKGKVIITMD